MVFHFTLSPEGLTSQMLDSHFSDQGTEAQVQVLEVQGSGIDLKFAACVLQLAVYGSSLRCKDEVVGSVSHVSYNCMDFICACIFVSLVRVFGK